MQTAYRVAVRRSGRRYFKMRVAANTSARVRLAAQRQGLFFPRHDAVFHDNLTAGTSVCRN
jgi:anti-sigma factor ChrR (cupin superfamily)